MIRVRIVLRLLVVAVLAASDVCLLGGAAL